MADKTRLEKGKDVFAQVYGSQTQIPPGAEDLPFQTLMLQNLFADIWGRETMSIRDRRLILIGATAAVGGDASLIEIQLRAALEKGELKREQLREIPIFLTQYIGYPRTVPVMFVVEKILKETAGGP